MSRNIQTQIHSNARTQFIWHNWLFIVEKCSGSFRPLQFFFSLIVIIAWWIHTVWTDSWCFIYNYYYQHLWVCSESNVTSVFCSLCCFSNRFKIFIPNTKGKFWCNDIVRPIFLSMTFIEMDNLSKIICFWPDHLPIEMHTKPIDLL